MKTTNRLGIAVLTALATAGMLATTLSEADTGGMNRRGERRDDRQESRDVKDACKEGDEKSRSECREEKRDTKQEGRGDDDETE